MDLVTEQKLERRERILEAARQLIAEHGYDGLTMRDLASHCRVSVPTLYNQFGSKGALLTYAVEAHFGGLLSRAHTQRAHGVRRLVGVVDVCTEEMLRIPRYYRSLMSAFLGTAETVPLQATLARELSTAIGETLAEMQQREQLEAWASPAVLARQITAACIASCIVWSLGGLDDRSLRAAMVHAATAMTLGAASGSTRGALEREVRKAQAILEQSTAAVESDEESTG